MKGRLNPSGYVTINGNPGHDMYAFVFALVSQMVPHQMRDKMATDFRLVEQTEFTLSTDRDDATQQHRTSRLGQAHDPLIYNGSPQLHNKHVGSRASDSMATRQRQHKREAQREDGEASEWVGKESTRCFQVPRNAGRTRQAHVMPFHLAEQTASGGRGGTIPRHGGQHPRAGYTFDTSEPQQIRTTKVTSHSAEQQAAVGATMHKAPPVGAIVQREATDQIPVVPEEHIVEEQIAFSTTLDCNFSQWNSKTQTLVVNDIAAYLQVKPTAIEVLSVRAGSVILETKVTVPNATKAATNVKSLIQAAKAGTLALGGVTARAILPSADVMISNSVASVHEQPLVPPTPLSVTPVALSGDAGADCSATTITHQVLEGPPLPVNGLPAGSTSLMPASNPNRLRHPASMDVNTSSVGLLASASSEQTPASSSPPKDEPTIHRPLVGMKALLNEASSPDPSPSEHSEALVPSSPAINIGEGMVFMDSASPSESTDDENETDEDSILSDPFSQLLASSFSNINMVKVAGDLEASFSSRGSASSTGLTCTVAN